VPGEVAVEVVTIDNSVPTEVINYVPEGFVLHTLASGENKGYFGAVTLGMEQFSPKGFDFVIISNVDVVMDKDFFAQLINSDVDDNTGWIAPQIYSDTEHRDRNPKIMRRYAKRKLQIMKIKFRFPLVNWVYNHTLYKSKKLVSHKRGEIYAGHGSFIILTRHFFKACGIINYPVFLFCEEIYLGELCQQHGLKVVYEPSIRITDAEHASTGTFRRSKYCRFNYQALSYILKTYY
jgi:GT2 family glycosyltransferase